MILIICESKFKISTILKSVNSLLAKQMFRTHRVIVVVEKLLNTYFTPSVSMLIEVLPFSKITEEFSAYRWCSRSKYRNSSHHPSPVIAPISPSSCALTTGLMPSDMNLCDPFSACSLFPLQLSSNRNNTNFSSCVPPTSLPF